MTWRTVIRRPAPASASRRLRAMVRDEGGGLLPASALTALTVTLTDQATGAVINGREAQDILGVNGGTVSETGQLTLWLGPNDTAIQDPARTREVRIAVIEWDYAAGKRGHHEVVFAVVR